VAMCLGCARGNQLMLPTFKKQKILYLQLNIFLLSRLRLPYLNQTLLFYPTLRRYLIFDKGLSTKSAGKLPITLGNMSWLVYPIGGNWRTRRLSAEKENSIIQ